MSAHRDIDRSIAGELSARLLDWYRIHKRDLPWRGGSPYAVWVSEIMLQQTQVATVVPFFNRFMARFPTVEALAAAPIDEVLRHWAGLGYYARARNLHKAAGIVVADFGGTVPRTPEEIETLPGIGRYTSGAILSIAYNSPRPLVDANVARVLSRVFGLQDDPKSTPGQTALWSIADQLIPASAPGDFNQALMELGALVCEPSEPKCEKCPLLEFCVAGNSPDPAAFPRYAPGRAPVSVSHSSALVRRPDDCVLIVQRPLHGLWGGLWEFPRAVCSPGEDPEDAAVRGAFESCGVGIEIDRRIAKIKHSVTHHRITLYGFSGKLMVSASSELKSDFARWAPIETLDDYAFSAPQALLRGEFRGWLERRRHGDPQIKLFDET